MASNCPGCGQSASGKFCAQCGTALDPAACSACQSPLAPQARFCANCGAARGSGGAAPAATMRAPLAAGSRLPWIVTGVLAIVAIAATVRALSGPSSAPVAAPAQQAAAPGAPPDLSTMTPREQFSRLSDRVTAAAEQGDSATVTRFWPMVLGAYQNLPDGDRDADARFHMGWLHLQVGQRDGAAALADTILATSPSNLFGLDLRAAVAESRGDSTAARKARAEFRAHYAEEIKRTDQPGYEDHRAMFDRFMKGTP